MGRGDCLWGGWKWPCGVGGGILSPSPTPCHVPAPPTHHPPRSGLSCVCCPNLPLKPPGENSSSTAEKNYL